jgi:serine/threonine protein kinase
VLQLGLGGVMEDYGTPDYASPERLSGNANVDHRADLYSVGAVLHEMLTGKTPAAADALGEFHTLPEPYAAVVSRCLMAEPERRYHDAKALKAEIIAPRSLPAPRMNNYTSTIPIHRPTTQPLRSSGKVVADAVPAYSTRHMQYLWAVVTLLGLAVIILSYLLVQHWDAHHHE